MTGGNNMFDYDFENKNYDVRQAVEDAKTNPEVCRIGISGKQFWKA